VAERAPTVLVVDDEPSVRTFVDRVLRAAGYTTLTATNGPEALALSERGTRFDLLLTDVRMPGMEGDELARRLRERDPTLKVLYLTGYSDDLFKRRHALWADEAFLDKPCSREAVEQAVSLLLYGHVHPPS
jgi:two-component system cell cycle sensor histidine kinase/response regulator CckA